MKHFLLITTCLLFVCCKNELDDSNFSLGQEKITKDIEYDEEIEIEPSLNSSSNHTQTLLHEKGGKLIKNGNLKIEVSNHRSSN